MTYVYTVGVWDLLHIGHVNILKQAAGLGDRLFVGVPSDEVVTEDKGRPPILSLPIRAGLLSSLKHVSVVIPYYKLDFLPQLEMIHPDVFVAGEFWGNQKRHRLTETWCKDNGCRFLRLPYTKGISTTDIINKVLKERS